MTTNINFRVKVLQEIMSSDSEDSQESDEEHVKLKTVLWCRDDSYGYTRGTTKKQKEKNYKRETTFRLKPLSHVPGNMILI